MQFEDIEAAILKYHPSPDMGLIRAAYEFAYDAHKGQVRASGEPYLNHLVETSLLACQMKLDVPSIAAALLHDTIEDCVVTRDELKLKFGIEIAETVEAVTKLTRIEFSSTEEHQAENFRKMLIAMAKDIRVILVKLCDRLHNMRTLGFLPVEKQRRIANETKEIYAPLANRLGIHWLKSELEDLCLLYLRPEIYKLIRDSFDKSNVDREKFLADICKDITDNLKDAGVGGSVSGRAKHYGSVWQKMEKGNLSVDEIHDLLGFRILVPTVRACYETLGIMHSVYKPVPGRFKDYIAMPKPNMYQSLHTTVIAPDGQRIEVQIRTPEMHNIAEEGIAAHWRYKEGSAPAFDLKWVRDLVETQQYLKNPDEFIQSVKGELFPEEVFVFTPRGDLHRLPFGATPVDFGYSVHTDVGHHTTGAKINGVMVPLDHKLQNGDTVEIITAKNHVPSKDWLRYVQTSKAKQRIRAFLKTEERARSLATGMELLTRDLRKVKHSLNKLEGNGKMLEVAQSFSLKTEGDLYVEVGYGKITTAKVLAKILPEVPAAEELADAQPKESSPIQRIFQRAARASRQRVGVRVSGFGDIMVRFAKCCEPLPGDRIVGFITRGRGVTVHFAQCPLALQSDPQRKVEVIWDDEYLAPRRVTITVHAQDQVGLLANVTQAITAQDVNIASAQVKTTNTGKAVNTFELTVTDATQLDKIRRAIEMVPGVIKVERVKPFVGDGPADPDE